MGLTINRNIYNYGFSIMGGYMSPAPMTSFFGYGFGGYSPYSFRYGFYNPGVTSAFAGGILGFTLGAGLAGLLKKHKS